MTIRVWAAAVLLLSGAVAWGEDGARTLGRTESSVLSAEDFSAETAPVPILSPVGVGAACGPEGWQQFRHGDLWSDYCSAGRCGTVDDPPAGGYLVVSPPRAPGGTLWAWRGWIRKPCGTCRQKRRSALDLLRGLFGWKRRTVYHVACYDHAPRHVPIEHHPIDDPAPLPPDPMPADDPDPVPSLPRTGPDRTPSDALPLEPAPTPGALRDPDMLPTPNELPTAPADDPAPEPQPEIRRNQLPKPQPAVPGATDASRAARSRTVLAGRLSDYIHTR